MTKAALAASALALLASCSLTHVGKYDPGYFAPWRIAQEKRLEGRALVLTTAADDAYVWSGPPTGVVGSATTLTLPLGVIAREAALRVFGELFIGGADASTDAARLEGYRAVVTPRITAFAYRYGFSSMFTDSSELGLCVHVALLDAGGAVVFEKTYDSGRVEVAGGGAGNGAESISPAVHVAAQKLMLQAGLDVRAQLAPAAASSPATSPPGREADEGSAPKQRPGRGTVSP